MINYFAVFVAALASMVLGAVWFSPLLFVKPWMKLMKFTEKDRGKAQAKCMGKMYALAFLSNIVMSYVLDIVVHFFGATTLLSGFQVGFWMWLGFIATTMLGGVLWEGKPLKLYAITAGHQLVSLLIMSAILAVWM